ncbi:tellurite resistance TerB family protein [Paenalcaligenes niemegkensis]|uniref:tellurite resistance TerB family protein n=1 Tax=Paenalcaligenes niemegkensis TaxID=2895469 RepID=UPI001EE930AD|nr:tellurite resistance TerB family protein [Paenalcaligenes niemegkensis]MCQ9615957.1 tellurite resistance TerB family protein [Paenalcaligenes niemegkensis]
MSIQNLLQKLLASGEQSVKGLGSDLKSKNLGGFSGGALAGGALGLLLGNKKFRKMGGSVAGYGGAAALGAIALKAYQGWENNKTQAPSPATVPTQTPAPTQSLALNVLTPTVIEDHSTAILAAIIAAAKADGHISADEQQHINEAIKELASDPTAQAWFQAELNKAVDPQRIAQLANTPEQAAEIYLASALVIDEQNFMERSYLDELGKQLKLEPELRTHLEAQLKQ